jgi:hypothetical protein
MSIHALVAAAYIEDLEPAVKLILMAMCDSSDERTGETAPGIAKLRAWSGRSRSQTTRIVKALEDSRYIGRVSRARTGRRAVWRVFPDGMPTIPSPDEVAARYEESGTHPCAPDPSSTLGITDDEDGDNPPERDAPMRPLVAHLPPERDAPIPYPASVSRGSTPTSPVETRRSASGFPGSRATVEEDRAIARRARGANDVPCPLHSDMIVPCGRCAHEAAKVSDEDRAARLKALRAKTRPAPAPTSRTARTSAAKIEEPTP